MSAITWTQLPTEVRRPTRSAAVAPTEPAVRLTRRGRFVVTAVALVLAGGAALSGQSAAADAPGEAVEVVMHTVAPGETLWEVAAAVAGPSQDVRDVVDRLVDLNGLTGAGVQAGQQILVPRAE